MSTLIPTIKTGNKKTTESNFNRLPSLPSWFDDILGKNFGNEFISNFNTGITLPAVNLINLDNEFIVEMAAPGLKKSDFIINLDNDILYVGAETKSEVNEEHEQYTRREFGYSSFKRTFVVPEIVETEKISAEYNDGILKVKLPKKEEAKKKAVKVINIK